MNKEKKHEEIVKLLTDLIAIDSSNIWLSSEGKGEKEVQFFMKEYLEDIGIKCQMEKVDEKHFNLTASIEGKGGGKSLTLYAHADTVGYELWKDSALKAKVEGDNLIGLGSADDKGHCAAILLTAKELIENNVQLKGNLNMCFVADEEGESKGSFAYVKRHNPEAVLILESSPINYINITHQGFGWLKIKVKGKAGHGSAGNAAIDAIEAMAEVIVRLKRNRIENFASNPHPLNGETVYHTGTIKGGTNYATYPDYCELGIEIGTQPGETIENRIKEIDDIFKEIKKEDPNFQGEVEVVLARSPFNTCGTEELLAVVSKEIERTAGKKAKQIGENAWGDAQIFQDAGFPTLGIGAIGGNLHAPDEWVSISDIQRLVNVLVGTIKEYCS